MTDFLHRTWAEIDLTALGKNYFSIRSAVKPGCRIMAVVKADAYGHGEQLCAGELERLGADFFGVSNLDEAVSLRGCGITKPILILGPTPPEEALALARHGITQTVPSYEYAVSLSEAAKRCSVTLSVHVKIDTGMGRIGLDGFVPMLCADSLQAMKKLSGLSFDGVFTHFSSADEDFSDGRRYTTEQFSRFMAVLDILKSRGITFPLRHCCNSAATLLYPEMHLDMVRPGLILYGLYPSKCCRKKLSLSPVMALKSVLTMVKSVPEGRFISYGRTFSSGREMKVATVPIGYADGYPRSLSGSGEMLLGGKRVPVIGRVCMDQLMLDSSSVPEALAGDEVVIIGGQEGELISANNLAEGAGTINYELVCLIGKRVPRLYLKNGEQVTVGRYINSCAPPKAEQ